MKAILVIDIPDFINTVTNGILKPIGTVGKLEIGYGSDDGEMTRFQFVNTNGVLLKPIPKRKQKIKELPQYTKEYEAYCKGEVDGWNFCLDEILGAEE